MFCIKCGVKLSDKAKFCHGCGNRNTTPEDVETTQMVDPVSAEPVVGETATEYSSEATADTIQTEHGTSPSKSKNLWIGLAVGAVIIVGGFAWIQSVLGTVNDNFGTVAESISASTSSSTSTDEPNSQTTDINFDREQEKRRIRMEIDWDKAKASGRITDLGEFVKTYPDSPNKINAETSAFDSLNRQNSYEAYITYKKHFGDAGLSNYQGPRVKPETNLRQAIQNRSIEQIAKPLKILEAKDPDSELVEEAYEVAADIVQESQSEAVFMEFYIELGYEAVRDYLDDYVGPFRITKNGVDWRGVNLTRDEDHPVQMTINSSTGFLRSVELIGNSGRQDKIILTFTDGAVATFTETADGKETCEWRDGRLCDDFDEAGSPYARALESLEQILDEGL